MEAESKGRKKNTGVHETRRSVYRCRRRRRRRSTRVCLEPDGNRSVGVARSSVRVCVGEARGGDVRAYARGGGRRALPEEMKRGRRATTTRFECRYSVRENSR